MYIPGKQEVKLWVDKDEKKIWKQPFRHQVKEVKIDGDDVKVDAKKYLWTSIWWMVIGKLHTRQWWCTINRYVYLNFLSYELIIEIEIFYADEMRLGRIGIQMS